MQTSGTVEAIFVDFSGGRPGGGKDFGVERNDAKRNGLAGRWARLSRQRLGRAADFKPGQKKKQSDVLGYGQVLGHDQVLGHGQVQFESAPRKPGQHGLPGVELVDGGGPVMGQVH